jgi:hypothetical protein
MLPVRMLRYAKVNKYSPTPLLMFVSMKNLNLLILVHASFVHDICSNLDVFTQGTSIGVLN